MVEVPSWILCAHFEIEKDYPIGDELVHLLEDFSRVNDLYKLGWVPLEIGDFWPNYNARLKQKNIR